MYKLITIEMKAWLNRRDGSKNIIQILPDRPDLVAQRYELYTAYEEHTEHLGRILFDDEGYWIYDGNDLSVDEQEQLATFILGFGR
ncbi:hypothetical protein [Mucilaginibacter terrae]|uniref:Uncharacterized protein n=1 Tax=Mucilaginibacter terrae TaxID=1955052 RepID=A0ABU3GPX6_9SPHI|nr:hypothetical protein [Mucilaginibacter terrae]MDT3401017.1 hypothetical protein [Mucilaginibacter terrae]